MKTTSAFVSFCFAAIVPAMIAQPNLTPTCTTYPFSHYPYCDSSLSVDERVKDLLARMTLAEKIDITASNQHGVPRLGIRNIIYGEGLHGVFAGCAEPASNSSTGCPTDFPNPTALASSFDRDLWRKIGFTIGQEGRALHNNHVDSGWVGLFFWTPDINLFRDPRWGRGQEVPGEDPVLTSQYAIQYIKGLQGLARNPEDGSDQAISPYLQIGATCKHFLAYDLENWNGTDRVHFDAKLSTRDLVEYYLPVFKACVQEAQVASVMCSYNAVNGVPSCANGEFMNGILREKWGFGGFVVSDCGGVASIKNCHKYTQTDDETIRAAIKAGTDINCGDYYTKHLPQAIQSGVIQESDLDLALSRMLKRFVLLGELEGPDDVVFQTYDTSHVDTPETRALSLRAAEESMVLLKNDPALLPLSAELQKGKILFVGPHANATESMQSNYAGTNKLILEHSPLLAAKRAGLDVTWVPGHSLDVANTTKEYIPEAVEAAKSADLVIAFLGLCADHCDTRVENEGNDRNELTFPGSQLELLQAVAAVNPNTVLVLINNGGAIDISWAKEKVPSILEAWYPGQLGGDAILHTLTGKNNPSGKLPTTVYPASFVDNRSFFDMDMRSVDGITYQWYRKDPLYEFGQGLSYTTFTYEWLDQQEEAQKASLSALKLRHENALTSKERSLEESGALLYTVKVTNTGQTKGDAIVLGFITGGDGCTQPLKKLFDFDRVFGLNPGESSTVTLTVPMDALASFAREEAVECGRNEAPVFTRELKVEAGDILNPAKGLLHLV